MEALRAGDLHAAVGRIASTLAGGEGSRDDPAVVLANVTVADDGGLEVDDCGPRRVVPTNRLLARFVAAPAGAGPPAVTAPATDGGRPLT